MKKLHAALTALLIVALVVSAIRSSRAQRELERQLQTLADANSVLKESLGELTKAITEKEKQIDNLQQPRPGIPSPPPNKKLAAGNAL
jgi:cell division protein FtsB